MSTLLVVEDDRDPRDPVRRRLERAASRVRSLRLELCPDGATTVETVLVVGHRLGLLRDS